MVSVSLMVWRQHQSDDNPATAEEKRRTDERKKKTPLREGFAPNSGPPLPLSELSLLLLNDPNPPPPHSHNSLLQAPPPLRFFLTFIRPTTACALLRRAENSVCATSLRPFTVKLQVCRNPIDLIGKEI